MRILVTFFALIVSAHLVAQDKEKMPPTDTFTITGRVEKEVVFGIKEISALPSVHIPDVVITNHLGEVRGVAKGLKGILVKDILAEAVINAENPKVFSEFYFTFVASDGYSVVYSWNELFNLPNGDACYLVTEKDGKKLAEMPDRLLVITPVDFRTGRRNIKGLTEIRVARTSK